MISYARRACRLTFSETRKKNRIATCRVRGDTRTTEKKISRKRFGTHLCAFTRHNVFRFYDGEMANVINDAKN